jgi:WD40 repeat protein
VIAVTPDGQVQDLGRHESVVGSTAEGVLVVGTDSVPVWIGASGSGEGDGSFTFEPGTGPVTLPDTGPVQSVALSGDGRYLAWLDLEDRVTVWDLKADALRQQVQVSRDAAVTSVSDRGVLVSEDGDLRMFVAEGVVEVPTQGDGYGSLSDTMGDFVGVADRDDITRIYDVNRPDGQAELVDTVPGTGRLAPYAEAMVSVDGTTARLFTDGEPRVLAVEGTPQSAGWLDEDHALVTSAESGGTSVWVCPVADATCSRVAFSQDDVRLAEQPTGG